MKNNDCCVIIPVPTMNLKSDTDNILQACERVSSIKECVLWSMMDVDWESTSTFSFSSSQQQQQQQQQQPPFLTVKEEKDIQWIENSLQRGKEIIRMMKNIEERFVTGLSRCNKVVFRLALPIQSLFFLSDIIQDKAILPLATGTGAFAPVNLQDVGMATANLLSTKEDPLKYNHQKFSLTGPQLVTADTLTSYASDALNTKLTYRSLTIQEFDRLLQRLVSIGEMTEFGKDILVYRLLNVRENKAQLKTNDLSLFLANKEPTSIEKFFQDNSQAFKPGSAPPTSERMMMEGGGVGMGGGDSLVSKLKQWTWGMFSDKQ
ncbi:hypothetical protein HMI55_000138 [Coelomomyces lativittatus]|nr:hypothetical protein HMI56_004639 [Coelomomyces lativittatus]KAJ1508995.1 hypothetical protein HMI55_000138 [Coelomomyces lativittatus]